MYRMLWLLQFDMHIMNFAEIPIKFPCFHRFSLTISISIVIVICFGPLSEMYGINIVKILLKLHSTLFVGWRETDMPKKPSSDELKLKSLNNWMSLLLSNGSYCRLNLNQQNTIKLTAHTNQEVCVVDGMLRETMSMLNVYISYITTQFAKISNNNNVESGGKKGFFAIAVACVFNELFSCFH